MIINKNSLNIAKFDFLSSIKSKGFIILNLVLCLLVIVAINITSVIDLFKSIGIIKSSDFVIHVYDADGSVFDKLIENNDSFVKEIIRTDEYLEFDYDSIDDKIIAVNILKDETKIYSDVEVITKDTINNDIYEYISQSVSEVRNEILEEKYGISASDSLIYKENITIEREVLSEAKTQDTIGQMISMIAGYVIFMIIMTSTATVASKIANEKTSKSAEYIFSAIPAKDYLNGKVIAANIKTIVTIVLVVFYCLIGLVINSVLVTTTVNMSEVTQIAPTESTIDFTRIIVYLVTLLIQLLVSNTLLSYIQAYLVSKIKSVSELDNATILPITILGIAFALSNSLVFMPEMSAMGITIMACVPVLSMFVLPTAYLLNRVQIGVIILSILILIGTLILTYRFVTKHFKNNILDLGKKKIIKNEKKEKTKLDEEIEKVEKSKFSKYITCVSLVLILSIVIGNIIGIIPAIIGGYSENISLILNICIFVVYIGLPALVLQILLKEDNNEKEKTDNLEDTRKTKVTCYLMGLVGIILAQVINFVLVWVFNIPQSEALEQALQLPSNILGIILFVIYLAIAPAIFEELLFRKAILNGGKKFGTIFAIVFSSVMFGLFHQNLQQIFGTALIGLVLAYITVKTGDIWTAVILHFSNNMLALAAQMMMSGIGMVKLVALSYILLFFILLLIGFVILIKMLIQNRTFFKICNKEEQKFKIKDIFFNYYMIILVICIVFTVILNLKV
ncbi:MAG: CPBP family intramembrane metalloprotease [Clostridia bacterium]|nr:CPBP family intramembrane metalloprotease [Clostridia bacterium]